MHGPTPTSVPGGRTVTTEDVVRLIRSRRPFLTLDVLGGPETLPGAVPVAAASAPGSFDDATQREFGRFLERATGGDRRLPLLLYCQSVQCWMSYNAALRAIDLGHSEVLWYRGGIEAWKMAGMRTVPPGAGFGPGRPSVQGPGPLGPNPGQSRPNPPSPGGQAYGPGGGEYPVDTDVRY